MSVLTLDHVTKSYAGGVVALDDVSLAVDAGELLAIVGPPGSGKSTLLAIMGTLDAPTAGTVRVDGVDAGTLGDRRLSALRGPIDLLAAIGGRMASGGFLGPATSRFPAAVLGYEAAARLGFDRIPSPRAGVRIGNRWFSVIGILAPAPLAPDLDQSVLVGWDAAGSMLGFDGHPTASPGRRRACWPRSATPRGSSGRW